MSEAFDAFLARCWADHADHADAVAERLRGTTPVPERAQQLVALTRLLVHVLAEHLGLFDEARQRLAALAAHPLADAPLHSALRCSAAALDLAEGRIELPPPALDCSESVQAISSAAALRLGRGDTAGAQRLIAAARQLLAALPDSGPVEHRPLAVACNNLMWALQEKGVSRSALDTSAMLELAAAAREHWLRAGGWLEVERADYGLAIAHLSAGHADLALAPATQCLAACMAHDAPPYECFFAHEALARVQHARGDATASRHHRQSAQVAYDRLDADDRSACQTAMDGLNALNTVQ